MSSLEFTGERMVPHLNKGATLYFEHLIRYLFAARHVKDKRVLDLACGAGYGSDIFRRYGARMVHGVDKSPEAIRFSRAKYKSKRVSFTKGDVLDLSFLDKKFDVIVAFEILEHIKKQKDFIKGVKNRLKNGGFFFVSTPNKSTYPKGNRFHKKELDVKQLIALLSHYFKNIKLFHQNFILSNILVPAESEEMRLKLAYETLYTSRQRVYRSELENKNSQFFLAVCSDEKIGRLEPIIISSSRVDNIDLSLGTTKLSKELGEKDAKIAELTNTLEEIKSAKTFKLWQAMVRYRSKLKNFISRLLK